jgi:hypothetical protein
VGVVKVDGWLGGLQVLSIRQHIGFHIGEPNKQGLCMVNQITFKRGLWLTSNEGEPGDF